MTLYQYIFNKSWYYNMHFTLPTELINSDGYNYFLDSIYNKMDQLSVMYGESELNYNSDMCDAIFNNILVEFTSKIIIYINRVNTLSSTYSTTESISDDSGYAGFDKDNQDGVFQNKLINRSLNDPKIQLELIKDEIANIPNEIISYYVSRIIPSIWDGFNDI